MPTSHYIRCHWHTLAGALGLLITATACARPTPTTATPVPASAPDHTAPATEPLLPPAQTRTPTGFAVTTWDMTAAELHADGYPELGAAAITWRDRQATARFTLEQGHLVAIHVVLLHPFADMTECADDFADLRQHLDRDHGASQADNLAAYWTTPHSEIELACNPADEPAEPSHEPTAILSIDYQPRVSQ